MTTMKFWKTTVLVTVLTAGEGPPQYADLSDIAHDIVDGDASGQYTEEHTELTKEEMSVALVAQGSDPEFLLGDEEDQEG